MQLLISEHVKKTLSYNIEMDYPFEHCALLYGVEEDNVLLIHEVKPIKNYARSGRFFLVSSSEISKSKNHLAFFHSHNSGDLALSALDKKNFNQISQYWVLGRLSSQNLILKAYNNKYEDINIKF